MMFVVPINETSAESVINFDSNFSWLGDIPSHIKPELPAFEKTTHRLRPNNVVGAIKYSMNMSKNLILCHLKMSNAEIDQKYEIKRKNK
jgi:hypothetical protein